MQVIIPVFSEADELKVQERHGKNIYWYNSGKKQNASIYSLDYLYSEEASL
jgi:hypothetical protein